jgi:hypothetical protein
MHVHPDLTTALLAERERSLRTRAERGRLLPKRERRVLSLPVFGATRLSR